MRRLASGLLNLCLMLLVAGCASSGIKTVPVLVTPMVPPHLTAPLSPPAGSAANHRDLLELLADYEALRRRANADRAAIVEIMAHDAGDQD